MTLKVVSTERNQEGHPLHVIAIWLEKVLAKMKVLAKIEEK
jgi:hypothetical protein